MTSEKGAAPEKGDLRERDVMAPDPRAAAKSQLRDEGWCVLPDVLDPETAHRALDRLWAAAGLAVVDLPVAARRRWR